MAQSTICQSIFEKYGIAPDFYSDMMRDIEDNLYDLVAATTYDAASEIARNDNKWDTWCEYMHTTMNEVETFVIPSEVPSLGKHNMFLDGIAVWAKSAHSWDDTLSPDVLHLYSAWCITLEAIQAGSCSFAARTAPDALLHTIFSGGSSDESRHTMYTEVNVLLPVMLDSPYPLEKARADTCFGMVLPKDVKHQIELACFANGSMAYTRSLRCMDTQGPAIVLGTFFAEWKRNSTSSDASRQSRQAVYYGCAMQALRRILTLPVRPLYGMVFEKGVLHLAAMTIDSADNSYVQFQQSDAHSWDLREPSALVECFYFILALKKTVDANLKKDFDDLLKRDSAALIDWDALRKRADDWRKYDAGRSKTAKIKRLKGARKGPAGRKDGAGRDGGGAQDGSGGNNQGGNRDTKDPAHGGSSTDERSGGHNNESTNVDRKSDDYEMDSDESSSDVEASDPEEHDAKFVSILSWRHGKEYPVKDREAWYRDPESLKLLDV
ncbi:hypothetical protein PLEOSDRAFT_1109631 [Pleurotus ostreatus PC15]|uniref:Uncharacterized protein n=1 Tax=Pleurotus ostreatus (strain PC15) TaxID=1137138 RepID=A0A067N6C3_PLEO1|nr:hypothetical protein PLEOSDRAFT_1109631 [Pleurotus ostreatus PC15]